MAFIVQAEIHNNWSKLDRYVFTMHNLSDGAKVLYGYLIGLKDGDNFNDGYIIKALNISKNVLAKRKRELKDYKLLTVLRMGPKTYINFIGNTMINSDCVKADWIERQDVLI